MKQNDILVKAKKIGKKALEKLKEHFPTILVGAGVIGFTGTVVIASKETVEAQEDISKAKEVITEIKNAKNVYPEDQYGKDLGKRYISLVEVFLKRYTKTITGVAVSSAAIIFGHGTECKRHKRDLRKLAASEAAFWKLYNDYKGYRGNVVEDAGKEKDKEYLEVKDKNGSVFDVLSPFARVFDENSPYYDTDNAHYDYEFVISKWRYCNDLFIARWKKYGKTWMFNNEICETMGLALFTGEVDSTAGFFWDAEVPPPNDFIDFGLLNVNNKQIRDFVNGYEGAVWINLNSNCDVLEAFYESEISDSMTKEMLEGIKKYGYQPERYTGAWF